jgi:hypothetical protein
VASAPYEFRPGGRPAAAGDATATNLIYKMIEWSNDLLDYQFPLGFTER